MAINYTGRPGPVKGQYEQWEQLKQPGVAYSKAPKRGQSAPSQRNQGAAGQATPNFGSQQQTGGFPSVPQTGQQSAPDMSVYRQQSGSRYPAAPPPITPSSSDMNAAASQYGINPSDLGYLTSPGGAPQQSSPTIPTMTPDQRNAVAQQFGMNPSDVGQLYAPTPRIPYLESDSVNAMYDRPRPAVESEWRLTSDGGIEPVPGTFLFDGSDYYRAPGTPPTGRPGPSVPAAPPLPAAPVRKPTAAPPAANYMSPPAVPNTASGGLQNQLAMRDAFIASINNSLMQQQLANGLNARGAMPPQFNFPALYQQAGQMVANGWSNPLAALLG